MHKFTVLLSTVLLGSAMASSSAATYLLDFNTAQSGTYPNPALTWNIYAAPSEINGSSIADTAGSSAAGVTLSVAGTITDSGTSGTGAWNNPTGGPSWVTNDTSLSEVAAAGDYFFTSGNASIQEFTLTFSNLDAGSIFDMDLFSSRNQAGVNGIFEYSLDGGTSWTGYTVLEKNGSLATTDGWDTNNTQTQAFDAGSQGNGLARYMNVNGITLTGTTLDVRVMDAGGGANYSVLNALQLTITPVPEPASGLLALGGLGTLLMSRRMRRRG